MKRFVASDLPISSAAARLLKNCTLNISQSIPEDNISTFSRHSRFSRCGKKWRIANEGDDEQQSLSSQP
jgi:hypothetical protein